MQLLEPDQYADLRLKDQHVEDAMQSVEAAYLIERLKGCKTVLDLGWGSGIVASALHHAGFKVTVIEGAEAFCEASKLQGVSVIHARFEEYTPETAYDAVIASFVLEHVAEPIRLLKRVRGWSRRLLAVVGNANSYHRQFAVQMGLQPRLNSLSWRDKQVGHYRVYDTQSLTTDLISSGWSPIHWHGLMLKPLPNSMLAHLPSDVIKAMCEAKVTYDVAANIVVECR